MSHKPFRVEWTTGCKTHLGSNDFDFDTASYEVSEFDTFDEALAFALKTEDFLHGTPRIYESECYLDEYISADLGRAYYDTDDVAMWEVYPWENSHSGRMEIERG